MDHVQSLAMDSGRNGPVRAHRGDVIERGGPQVWRQPIVGVVLGMFCERSFAGRGLRTKDRDLQKVATRLGRSPGTLEECPDQFSPVVRDLLAQLAVLAEPQARKARSSTGAA